MDPASFPRAWAGNSSPIIIPGMAINAELAAIYNKMQTAMNRRSANDLVAPLLEYRKMDSTNELTPEQTPAVMYMLRRLQ